MATEIKPRPTTSVYGEQLALTTAITALNMPAGKNGSPCAGVALYCPTSDFRFQITPPLRALLKTVDAGATFQDYAARFRQRDGVTLPLTSLDTLANGDSLYIGSDRPFGGFRVDMATAVNGNASVMAVHYFSSAWGTVTATDGTASAGATFAQDGLVTWGALAGWAKTVVNGYDLYWVRVSVSAALDATCDIDGIHLLSTDTYRGYGLTNSPILIPLGSEDGGIEALVAVGAATLNLTWSFGNLVGM